MVIDMQDSDLMIIFPQNEKEGIHELNEFGEIIPPEDTYDLHISFTSTVCILTVEIVSSFPYSCHQLGRAKNKASLSANTVPRSEHTP